MISRDYTFKLTDEQYDKLEKWFYGIYPKGTYHGAIGGALSITITPTSIGEFVKAVAGSQVLDLTEEF